MSTIAAANSSAYNVLSSLLDDGTASSASANANASASKSRPTDSENSTSKNPVDTVDLSDTAKAIIARAKAEKAIAERL
jgi:hypothetical protein